MPRWLYASALIVYLTGLFGFGLYQHVTGAELEVGEAMAYGARWPLLMLDAFNVI